MVFPFRDSSSTQTPERCTAPAPFAAALAFALALGFLGGTPVFAQGDIELLRTIAAADNGERPFREASGAYLDGDGTLYLADTSGSVHVFTAAGASEQALAGKDRVFDSKKLSGIARLDGATFAVADTGDDRVAAVADLKAARYLIAEEGSREGRVSSPSGLAASARGRLYVADRGNRRISVFSRDGLFLFAFGETATAPDLVAGRTSAATRDTGSARGPRLDPIGDRGPEADRLSRPVQVAVDAHERVYVLDDRDNGVIAVYSPAGELLRRIGAADLKGSSERKPRLAALAADPRGHVLVADNANGRILEVDPESGRTVLAFGSKGSGRGQFDEVTALAINAGRELAVADSGNHKIEIYQLPPAAAATEGPRLPLVETAGADKLPDCDRAYALPEGGVLCLSREHRSVRRIGADGKSVPFNGAFDAPRAAAVDARDIAIVDGDRVKVYGHDGQPRFAIGGRGSHDGEFDSPGGVLLADRLYVSDTGNHRVQIFSRDGVYLDKIAASGDQELLRQPGALAIDTQNNLYVADNGDGMIRVFASAPDSAARTLLYALGAGPDMPGHFRRIDDLVVDRDDNLYVLAATEANDAAVRIYSGPRLMFTFGAQVEKAVGFAKPVTLSLAEDPKPALAVFDQGAGTMRRFHYLQVPGQVGGVAVLGGPQQTGLKWHKVPGSFVERYRVYGAKDPAGPFERVLETRQNSAAFTPAADKRYRYYRVSAVSVHGVEGQGSPVREDFFASGYLRFGEKRYAEAAGSFAQALRETPDSGYAREYLGRSLMEQGRHDDALAALQDLEKVAGFETTALNLQIETLLRAHQYPRAQALLDRARADRRADAQTFFLCGRTLLALNDALGASECLERAVALGRDTDETHLLLGQSYAKLNATQKAIAEFDKAAKLAPANAATWTQSGLAFQSLGMHKEAIERFEKALALDPVDPLARLGAARSHVALAQYDEAQSIATALTGSPEQEAAGYYLLGVIAQARKQPQEALLQLTRATAKDPANAAAWLALADVQAQLKNDAGALDSLRGAAKADPDNADTQFRLAVALQKPGNHAEAVEHFARAAELAPNRYDIRQAYTASLVTLDRLKDAATQAAEAARLAPNDVAPLLQQAAIARRQGKHGDAIGYLTQALKLKPASAEVNLTLGSAYYETSDYDQAKTFLEKAALLEPRNARPYEILGDLYFDQRLFDAAIKSYSKAAQLDPSAENTLHLNTAYAEKKKSAEFRQNAPRLVLQELSLKRVFSAAYKQYANEPVGSIKLKNLSSSDYKDLKLSFNVKGYMDFPVTTEIPALKGRESLELPLRAAFNNKILALDEDTGVQVEVKVAYFQDGREAAVDVTRPMTIYGKNAILWRDSQMVGAFITPKDETLKNFVRGALNRYGAEETALNRNLSYAMTVFDVISAMGTRYLPNPVMPYSKVSADQVDYVQFPRETLRSRSGDCSDLSVLLSAALENLGIETALVDVPGHLFLLFDTGLDAKDADQISTQDDLLVLRDNRVWIPLEATMIATSFSEAWAEGAKKYRDNERAGTLKAIPVKGAWERYMPVTLAPADFTVEAPDGERVKLKLDRERTILLTRSLDRVVRPYRAMLQTNPADQDARMQIAIVYARNGLYDIALKELDRVLEADASSSAAHNNRGNIYYTQGEYERALEAYRYAAQLDPNDGGIKLNLALTYYRLGRVREATENFNEAVTLNHALESQYKAFRQLLGG